MYRSAWTWSMVLAGAAGIWAALVEWSLGAVALFPFLAATTFCIRLAMNEEPHPDWRRAGTAAMVWGAAALAAFGLVAWLGVKGVALVALLIVLSPAVAEKVFRRVRGRTSGRRDIARKGPISSRIRATQDRYDGACHRPEPVVISNPSFLKAPWMTQSVESMDDATLCFAWRTSYVGLQQPLPLHCTVRIVQRRQEFLDELERRYSQGFQAWLASGARAAGDPTKYIRPARRQVHRHDQR